MRAWLAAVSLAGCDVVFGTTNAERPDAPAPDVPLDDADGTEVWTCPALPDFATWFTAQLDVPDVTDHHEPTLDVARDELIFVAAGDIVSTSFAAPVTTVPVASLSTPLFDRHPALWPDGEHIFVRQGSTVIVGTRNGASWDVAPLALPTNVDGTVSAPSITADHGTRIVVAATSGGLVELARASPEAPFAPVDTLGSFASLAEPRDPYLSPDGCWLLFSAQVGGSFDLFAAQRAVDGTWQTPVRLHGESAGGQDLAPTMSADGQHLLWSQDNQMMQAHPQ